MNNPDLLPKFIYRFSSLPNHFVVKAKRNDSPAKYIGAFASLEEAIRIRDIYIETGIVPDKKTNKRNCDLPKGVTQKGTNGKFYAVGYCKGKQVYLGIFPTVESAALARKEFDDAFKNDVPGVRLDEDGLGFVASVFLDGIKRHIGYFSDWKEARDARTRFIDEYDSNKKVIRDLPKGVYMHPTSKRFRAMVSVGNKKLLIGYFQTIEEAENAFKTFSLPSVGQTTTPLDFISH